MNLEVIERKESVGEGLGIYWVVHSDFVKINISDFWVFFMPTPCLYSVFPSFSYATN